MLSGLYLVEDVGDVPLLVQKECLAGYAHILPAVHRLLNPYAVSLAHSLVGVG